MFEFFNFQSEFLSRVSRGEMLIIRSHLFSYYSRPTQDPGSWTLGCWLLPMLWVLEEQRVECRLYSNLNQGGRRWDEIDIMEQPHLPVPPCHHLQSRSIMPPLLSLPTKCLFIFIAISSSSQQDSSTGSVSPYALMLCSSSDRIRRESRVAACNWQNSTT